MAKVEIVCPNCKRPQFVPTKRIHDPWMCMQCGFLIDDPSSNRREFEMSKLAIPLQGKIISTSGTTNLSEIVADSQAYSGGFSDIPWDPTKLQMVDFSRDLHETNRSATRQIILLVAGLLLALIAGAALVWFVIL